MCVYIYIHIYMYIYIYGISAHPCYQVMRRGNPHTFHTSTSPLAVLSPFFLRVLEKIIYEPTAYTSYTPAFLLPRYLHTLYRADSLSRTPAAPPLRLSHANCVISSTSPPTPPSPPSTSPPIAVFFVFPMKCTLTVRALLWFKFDQGHTVARRHVKFFFPPPTARACCP